MNFRRRPISLDSDGQPLILFGESELFVKYHPILARFLKVKSNHIFSSYLLDYPEYQKLFIIDNNPTYDSLKSDPMMKAHNRRVFNLIASLVSNVDHIYALTTSLRHNAMRHHKLGVPVESFNRLRVSIVDSMNKYLTKLVPMEAMAILIKALNSVFEMFIWYCEVLERQDLGHELSSGVISNFGTEDKS